MYKNTYICTKKTKMMKNKILVACFMLLPFSAYADNEFSDLRSVVNFQVSIIIPEKNISVSKPKSPVRLPQMEYDNEYLYFNASCYGCRVELADEFETIYMDEYIPEGMSQLEIPMALSGNYIIRLYRGDYCFTGNIVL